MDGGEQLERCLSLLDNGATEEGEGAGGEGKKKLCLHPPNVRMHGVI